MVKPIEIWTSVLTIASPNSLKAILILEELGTPYEVKVIRLQDVKHQPFLSLGPYRRVPLIVNHKTDVALWEPGAIVQYLIEQYDSQRKLTYDTLKEKNLLNQWLMLQMRGPEPYFGESGWYTQLNHEKMQSARDRYSAELKRILVVLEGRLSGSSASRDSHFGPRQWLVGDKLTYADLAFVPWSHVAGGALPSGSNVDPLKEFPHVQAWYQRMVSGPSFQKAWGVREKYVHEIVEAKAEQVI